MGLFNKKIKKLVCVDFGKTVVKIACLEASIGGFKLLNYDLKTISIDERKEEVFQEFINNFLKSSDIETKEIYLNIPISDTVVIKYLSLPVLPKDELFAAAKWQLKEEIPFDLETALFDWQMVREYTDEEGAKKNGVIFVAAKKETIADVVSIARACHLSVSGITTSLFNYTNILSCCPQVSPVSAILHIGNTGTSLGIYNNNRLNFSRKLIFSSGKLIQSLTGSLFTGKGKIEVSSEEAQNIIYTFGIPQDSSQMITDVLPASQVISLIRPHLETLVRELKSSFDYVSLNFNIEHPRILYLTGGGANLKNLNAYLREKLNIEVFCLSLPESINTEKIAAQRLEADKNQIVNAAAMALKGKFSVDLLPKEIKERKREFIQVFSLRAAGIVIGTVFLFLLFAVEQQVKDYKSRLKKAQVYLQNLLPVDVLKEKINLKEELIDNIQKGSVPAEGILKLISVLVPPEIILEELLLDQFSHYLTLRGTITVSENAVRPVLISFMQQLEKSLFIAEARLVFSEKKSGAQKFEIKCDLIR